QIYGRTCLDGQFFYVDNFTGFSAILAPAGTNNSVHGFSNLLFSPQSAVHRTPQRGKLVLVLDAGPYYTDRSGLRQWLTTEWWNCEKAGSSRTNSASAARSSGGD